MAAVSTGNIQSSPSITEVIGNVRADGTVRTARVALGDLATQLLADGPIATAVAGVEAGMIVATSLSDLDLAHPAKTGAWVVGAAGGIYRKIGASGVGSWERVADLPAGIVRAVDGGTGTANAIKISTQGGASEGAFVAFSAYRPNGAGTVTVSVDDGTPLALITVVGTAVTAAGAITAGMPVLARLGSTTLQMISDPATAAALAAKAPLSHVGSTDGHPQATETAPGLMSPADKAKLNGIAAGATVAPVTSVAGRTGAVTLGVGDVAGLGTAAVAAAASFVAAAAVGAAGGVAPLDSGSKIPAAYLPAYVDDVIDAANFAALPAVGEAGKIYVTVDNNRTWRWSGSIYVEISASPGSSDAVPEGVANLYFTTGRVRATTLTGLAAGSATAIAATDTVLQALAKLQAQLATYTADDVLAKIKTVDGSASGLDADVVRGTTPSVFGLSLLDDADQQTARTTLGLGSAAVQAATAFVAATAVGVPSGVAPLGTDGKVPSTYLPGSGGTAAAGANSDITSLSGLTTALSIGQGGTGSKTVAGARSALGFTADVRARQSIAPSTWRSGSIPSATWTSIVWADALGLFVAVGSAGKIATSPDGRVWTLRTAPVAVDFISVCWSPQLGLLVALATAGTGNRVATSPDGVTWTARASIDDTVTWESVCWSPERGLFVAVANNYTGKAVMTSPDGATWTVRTAPNGGWTAVCWAAEIGLFVAVCWGAGTVMTSPDAMTWTARAGGANLGWISICWSPALRLFVATADSSVAGNKVRTSPDGINWTARVTPDDARSWATATWAEEIGLFVMLANSGTGNRVAVSADGVTWTAYAGVGDLAWSSACWSPRLMQFAAVARSGAPWRAMVSASQSSMLYGADAGVQTTLDYAAPADPAVALDALVASIASGQGEALRLTRPGYLNTSTAMTAYTGKQVAIEAAPGVQYGGTLGAAALKYDIYHGHEAASSIARSLSNTWRLGDAGAIPAWMSETWQRSAHRVSNKLSFPGLGAVSNGASEWGALFLAYVPDMTVAQAALGQSYSPSVDYHEKDALTGWARTEAGADSQVVGVRGYVEVATPTTAASGRTANSGCGWGMNAVARVLDGSKGYAIGLEVNTRQSTGNATSKPGGLDMLGIKLVNIETGDHATAAIYVQKSDRNFWNGLVADQGAIVDDTAASFIELRDAPGVGTNAYFRVNRAGDTWVHNLYINGHLVTGKTFNTVAATDTVLVLAA